MSDAVEAWMFCAEPNISWWSAKTKHANLRDLLRCCLWHSLCMHFVNVIVSQILKFVQDMSLADVEAEGCGCLGERDPLSVKFDRVWDIRELWQWTKHAAPTRRNNSESRWDCSQNDRCPQNAVRDHDWSQSHCCNSSMTCLLLCILDSNSVSVTAGREHRSAVWGFERSRRTIHRSAADERGRQSPFGVFQSFWCAFENGRSQRCSVWCVGINSTFATRLHNSICFVLEHCVSAGCVVCCLGILAANRCVLHSKRFPGSFWHPGWTCTKESRLQAVLWLQGFVLCSLLVRSFFPKQVIAKQLTTDLKTRWLSCPCFKPDETRRNVNFSQIPQSARHCAIKRAARRTV